MCVSGINGKNREQDDCGRSPTETDVLFLSAVASDHNSCTDILSTLSTLPQNVYDRYTYICNFEKISENYNNVSLQEYEVECGYKLTEDFLSIMNKCKVDFIRKIDSVLVSLSSSFCFFFKGLKGNNKNLSYLMDKTCSSFSKGAYGLRPKCINILQYNIIPIVIKNIFDSRIVDGDSERKMTYPEAEKLFIHFVTSLEKLIMVKIMNYWQDFCNKNNIFSLISDIDYSNPFIRAYNFDGISIHKIACPAAFTKKFGEYISFIAIAKIDEMMSSFIDKSILYKFCPIFGSYGNGYNDIRGFRDKFKFLVREEFDKKIIEKGIKDIFKNFLDTIVIWNKSNAIKINMVLIFDNIIEYMNNFLVNTINNDLHDIVVFFQEGNRLGVYIHPEDNCEILFMRRKFSDKYRRVIKAKFCAMLRDEYKFSDGTVIGMFCWDEVSKNILPIIQDTIKPLVDDEYKDLSIFLSSARVVEDIGVFDGYCAGTRKATSEEIADILRISADLVHARNIEFCIKTWTKLIVDKKGDVPKDVDSAIDHKSVYSTEGGDSLVTSSSVKLTAGVPASVFLWGLNIHPGDYNLILSIRRKFSIQTRDHLTKLFYGMLMRRVRLPSGVLLCNSSWTIISGELSEVAIKSVDYITKKQYVELYGVLSKARIVEVDESNSSRIIRKVTDDEKKYLVMRISEFVDKRLRLSIRLAWLRVVNKLSTEVGYGYKERSKIFPEIGKKGSWGVKLRYSDNLSILNVRRKFSSKIKDVVYGKFSTLLKNNHKFDDGTFIGSSSWFVLSKKLSPIAKEEIKPILEDQRKELEVIISRSRVVADSVDREPTDEEKCVILKNIMSLVHHALKVLLRRVWDRVIVSLGGDSISRVCCVADTLPSLINVVGVEELCLINRNRYNIFKVKLCYEDDSAILNIKRKFSFEVCRAIRNKYTEMLRKKYMFSDGTVVGVYSWEELSEKISPIIMEEISPIIEEERREINDVLLKSRVYISLPGISSVVRATREVTCEERRTILETIMRSIHKQVIHKFSDIWNIIIRSPLVGFVNLKEEYKSELDNVRIEFIGSLVTIVNEVVYSLSSDIDLSSSSLEHMSFNACNIVYERSCNFFKGAGFLSRVESLLSSAKMVNSSGDRFITDEEKESVLKEFMDVIYSDIDNLVKKRAGEKFKDIFLPATLDSPEKLSVGCI